MTVGLALALVWTTVTSTLEVTPSSTNLSDPNLFILSMENIPQVESYHGVDDYDPAILQYDDHTHIRNNYNACVAQAAITYPEDVYDLTAVLGEQDTNGYLADLETYRVNNGEEIIAWWRTKQVTNTNWRLPVLNCIKSIPAATPANDVMDACWGTYGTGEYTDNMVGFIGTWLMAQTVPVVGYALENSQLGYDYLGGVPGIHSFPVHDQADAYFWYCYFSNETTFFDDLMTHFYFALDNGAVVPDPLSVTGIVPNSGSVLGGTAVVITGTGFVAGSTTVRFDGVNASNVTVVNSTTITAVTPPGAGEGQVNVVITVGVNNVITTFTYTSAPICNVGQTQACNVANGTGTQVCGADNDWGMCVATACNLGYHLDTGACVANQPSITAILPPTGSILGDTVIQVTGTQFGGVTSVTLDGVNCPFTDVNANTETQVFCRNAPHAAGAVDVVLTVNALSDTAVGGFTYVDDTAKDTDSDGIPDSSDNCPITANPDQTNSDGDIWGDACDNCINDDNRSQRDTDGDGQGNYCDHDDDDDGILDGAYANPGEADNCQLIVNADQTDTDGDGCGDVCTSCHDAPAQAYDFCGCYGADDCYCHDEFVTNCTDGIDCPVPAGVNPGDYDLCYQVDDTFYACYDEYNWCVCAGGTCTCYND